MHLVKTTFVTFGTATLLFLVWVGVLVERIQSPTNSKTFGLGLVYAPLVSVWFWVAVLAVGVVYYRWSR
jgi:hypothetical protein